jgi:MarR family transcriptional regulator, 2-MHQ and catechol-resistance regulon repressor
MNKKGSGARRPRTRDAGALYEELMGLIMVLQKDFLKIHTRFDFGELSRMHLGVLGVLRKNGEMSVSAIGEKLYTSRPQMTALLDRMEDLGLVRRGADPADRRVTTVTMTDAGRQVLEKALGAAHADISHRLAMLSERDLKEFGDALRTLQRVLAQL